jgi:hypothetical protein
MKCIKAEDIGQSLAYVFTVVVDTNKDSENAKFFRFTPNGQLTLSVVNPAIVFIPGREYYIDISPAIDMGVSDDSN